MTVVVSVNSVKNICVRSLYEWRLATMCTKMEAEECKGNGWQPLDRASRDGCGIGVTSFGALGHAPLDFLQFKFFHSDFVLLRYSTTAAAVVQVRLHEPCSVYYFASFYCDKKFHVLLPPPLTAGRGDATGSRDSRCDVRLSLVVELAAVW